MEIGICINKKGGAISISEWGRPLTGMRYNYYGRIVRKNSTMTKDLVKQEMMCRVYSFRPPKVLSYKFTDTKTEGWMHKE